MGGERDWEDGYDAGFAAGYSRGIQAGERSIASSALHVVTRAKKAQKRKQTGKAKILSDMTRPIWNKYKKGSGKKTYFDIRSQVRRSNAYRKKVKNL